FPPLGREAGAAVVAAARLVAAPCSAAASAFTRRRRTRRDRARTRARLGGGPETPALWEAKSVRWGTRRAAVWRRIAIPEGGAPTACSRLRAKIELRAARRRLDLRRPRPPAFRSH